jgi:predicted DNA-binding transcriptional regulator AlpA
MQNVTLQEIVEDPKRIEDVEEQKIPAMITQLAAVQTNLACRLIKSISCANGEDRLLTLDEAAIKLNVSRSWLYRRSKKLSFVVRTGRKVGFSERGLQEFIRQKQGK